MLRTLTGKHESDWRITGALQARHIFGHRSQPCCEVIFQLCYRSGGCGEAKRKLASANISGIAKVTNRCVGIVIKPVQKVLDAWHQRVTAFGVKGNQARKMVW